MVRYQVIVKASAEKELNKLPVIFINKIINTIETLATIPRPIGVKKLKGTTAYRIRVSNYRVIYKVDDSKNIITIFRIRHRKDVYRYLQ